MPHRANLIWPEEAGVRGGLPSARRREPNPASMNKKTLIGMSCPGTDPRGPSEMLVPSKAPMGLGHHIDDPQIAHRHFENEQYKVPTVVTDTGVRVGSPANRPEALGSPDVFWGSEFVTRFEVRLGGRSGSPRAIHGLRLCSSRSGLASGRLSTADSGA